MIIKRICLSAVAALSAAIAVSQNDVIRSSSSQYLQALAKPDVSLSFDIKAQGTRFEPTWGLDVAWIPDQWHHHITTGINHMGKDNIGIGRTAFRFNAPLVNDSVLPSDAISKLRERNTHLNKISTTLPLVLTADQDAGADEYFVKNKVADNEHWAAMINSHVHWLQANTKHQVLGVSPFNEGDYWSVEEGASPTKQWQVAKLLKEGYPRFADIVIVGGNTLNNDKALDWYSPGKIYYEWGNTHQLAGSFDTFANFFQQMKKDGKVGYADEMHNVVEAMVGLEYGMTVGIWWGFDSRARGEFCQISRHGERLSYGEHRNNWTAASVWRHEDGRVKAFIGSSERQAATTKYQFVSTDRLVYFDGYGPVREYLTTIPGGTGYQKGQTNAERVVDITWGEDVPMMPVTSGVYRIVNKGSGKAVAYTANGEIITMADYSASSKKQQWTVKPVTNRSEGDLSFFDIEALDNANIRMNIKNYSTDSNTDVIAWTQDGPTPNEQWYLEYAGDGYYYIRSRFSALYLAVSNNNVIQKTLPASTSSSIRNPMLWRLLPADIKYETTRPAQVAGLTAEAHAASVTLSWTANTDADLAGYMVMRAEKGTEDWNTVGRTVTANTFTDNTCCQGVTYIYKVKAVDQNQNRSRLDSEVVEATPPGERSLVAHWQMEGNLNDETANMMDAAANGNVRYNDGQTSGKALHLMSNQFVQLPYEVASSDELTVAMWVKVMNSTAWQRIFDFGNDTDHYMFLTPSNGSVMRFAIKNGGDEQTVDCKSKLQTGVWKHVAVTIGRDKTVIYVDGAEAGSATGLTIKPSDVHPVLNYLGRSQFLSDPSLLGDFDDVRIYNYAVSAEDVQTIMNGGVLTAVEKPAAECTTPTVYGLDGIRRPVPQKGINIIDGKKVVQ